MHDPRIASVLRESHVGIAGAGGLGSNAAMALARSGVGKLTLVDFDRIEDSNLNRQYFFLDQIGEFKVEALKHNIEAAVSGCEVEIINEKLTPGKMSEPFPEVDVVVEALDHAETKARFIEEILLIYPGKPIVAASGVAGIGSSDGLELIRFGDLYLVQDARARSSDEDVLLSPRVGLFAHYQANVVLSILLGGDP